MVAVGVVDVGLHPIVARGCSTLHRDGVVGVTQEVRLPRDSVDGAVVENVGVGVEVVVQTVSVIAAG